MMVMAVFAVSVAVLELFLGGLAHAQNFDVKVQGAASQRMVAIDMNIIAFDSVDFEDQVFAFRAVGLELHASSDLGASRELRALHDELQLGVLFAVAFSRSYRNLFLIADLSAFESVLQARNNLA